MKPLISVIIPTYNNAETIALALYSTQKQTYKNLEIIVVDDSSTDNTSEVVKKIANDDSRIKYIKSDYIDPNRYSKKLGRNINAGYSARNAGFKFCTGELITFQDADDASLLNRIETQYDLLKKYNADHVTLDWIKFNNKFIDKTLDLKSFEKDNGVKMVGPNDLYKLSQETKGVIAKIDKPLNTIIPFSIKRMPFIHKMFFGSLEGYPGTGNSPLFKTDVVKRVQFRNLRSRVWPSFMGRGADRDFNFQVAETFKNSYVFFIPLYMWKQDRQNEKYSSNIDKYIS